MAGLLQGPTSAQQLRVPQIADSGATITAAYLGPASHSPAALAHPSYLDQATYHCLTPGPHNVSLEIRDRYTGVREQVLPHVATVVCS